MARKAVRKAAGRTRAVKPKRRIHRSRSAGHPDQRYPVYNDPTHEIVCKWITQYNEYHCEKVPTGGDWNP